ncbi:MAG: hypothetical protein DRJ61_16680 [Acidobacteria bacterium]|nr:MAG: hypothetical protein DRJ61_16680 [Acidobacteriota bacterium]
MRRCGEKAFSRKDRRERKGNTGGNFSFLAIFAIFARYCVSGFVCRPGILAVGAGLRLIGGVIAAVR